VEVRKTVSVLFADVTGSTSMGERLDPEPLRHVMTRYFEEMRTVIEGHGGTVEKFIGDAVMAVFGVPILHEDDALRACRAAEEMQEAIARLNEELSVQLGVRLEVRIGVNTGEVVAGDPSAGQALVTGDAVNVAARLEQGAEPGEILIGEGTHRLVRDAARSAPVGGLDAKGKADPIPAHRLLGVVRGAPTVARRLDSPLIGRRAEMETLRGAFAEAQRASACRLVSVVGEAGAGKTRLVAELLDRVRDDARVLLGRCLPYGEGITFWPIAEAIRGEVGITDVDSPEEARRKLAGVLQRSEDAELVLDRVAAAFGLGSGGGELQETFWSVRRFLEALATDRPVVFVIEDIHWAERALLDLLQYVAGFTEGRALLIVCTARPELRIAPADWEGTTTVALGPLSERDSSRLIANLLGAAELPPNVRARISEAAEGNPLFVEEMLRMLIDDGLLVRDDGHWRQGGDLSTVSIPGSIQAILSARLDRLDPGERSVIQRAAVVGKVFYWGAVAALSPEEARSDVGAQLQTLVRKELVRPDQSGFAGEDAFRFSHILVRDAAYGSLPKRARAELHERFAGWLEHKAGDRLPEYEEILGYHLEQAHRYHAAVQPGPPTATAVASRAAQHLAAAGRRAVQRGDMQAAANLLGRTAQLFPADEPRRPAVLSELGTALTELGELDRATRVLTEATEAAAAGGDRGTEWRARVHALWVQASQDPHREWGSIMEEVRPAMEIFEELGDDAGLAKAWLIVAEMQNDLADRAEMERAAAKIVEHARRAGERREEAMGARLLAGVLIYGPTPVSRGVPRVEEMLREASGSPFVEAAILPVLGALYGMQGRLDEARACFDRARHRSDELGMRFFSARLALLAGDVDLLAGNPAAAERESRRGCEIFKEMGELGRFSTLAAQLGDALYALGRFDEAISATEESEMATGPSDVVSQADWRRVRAKALAAQGDAAKADELSREALASAERSPDDVHLQAKVLRDRAEVLRLAGRTSEAIRYLERALQVDEGKGNVTGATLTRSLLSRLDPPSG
jgi:class 3 adenylate cyclase/tetratricopeptide (TPR) repeat protein